MSILDQPVNVRTGEELPVEKLNDTLNNVLSDFTPIVDIKQYPGGYSNLTYLLSTSNNSYILRKPPRGAENIKGGHDMNREFNILKSVSEAGFKKIPKPLFFSEDKAIMGSDFYVMQKIEGTILRTANLHEYENVLPSSKMNTLSSKLCESLAFLHTIKIEGTNLATIGKPAGYIKRQVIGWYERYQKAQTESLDQIDTVYNWLSTNMPTEIEPCLIHNDYKFDNVVVDLQTDEIIAILDWEMTTIGDPRMDIGTCLSYWCEAHDDAFIKSFNLTWLPGNITKNEFVAKYQTINDIDLSNILYFYVFGLFKNLVIIQQIFARYKKRLTNDERFAKLGKGVKVLLNKAINSIEKQAMV